MGTQSPPSVAVASLHMHIPPWKEHSSYMARIAQERSRPTSRFETCISMMLAQSKTMGHHREQQGCFDISKRNAYGISKPGASQGTRQ
jgi:hypothetical protein